MPARSPQSSISQPAILGYQAYLIDQPAERLGRFGPELRPVQFLVQPLDPLPVEIGKLWMEQRCSWRRAPDLHHQSFLAGLEGEQFVLHPRRTQAVLDRLDDCPDLPLNLYEFVVPERLVAVSGCPQSVHLALILGGERLEQLRRHQVGLEPGEDDRLEGVAPDRQEIAASPAIARVRAAVICWLIFENPPPHTPHRSRPESR